MWLSQEQCSNRGCVSKVQKYLFSPLVPSHFKQFFDVVKKRSDFISQKSFYLTGNYIISSNHRTYQIIYSTPLPLQDCFSDLSSNFIISKGQNIRLTENNVIAAVVPFKGHFQAVPTKLLSNKLQVEIWQVDFCLIEFELISAHLSALIYEEKVGDVLKVMLFYSVV